ncbi:MAG: hypothetical protein U0V75_17360 [Ferruginibacter sp.]
MEFETFSRSLQNPLPPGDTSIYLQAMWYDANGHWDKAHDIVAELHDRKACLVHAYLHRKEGDLGNAAYWYSRASKEVPAVSLEQEWEGITKSLL